MPQAYDLVVIGAGTGGYVAAIRAAQLGLKTAVVERQKSLGGTCLLWGCIPTKALLEHAHALKIIQHAADWGVSIANAQPTLDITAVHTRKDKIVTGLTKGVESLFKKHGIAWIKGTARLTGQGSVSVTGPDEQTLQANHIIVATGSSPRSVPGITIDHQRIITSDEAIHLKEVPGRIVILGSGAVGVEFASIFNRFGSKVTLVELLPRLVPVEDEAVSAELERSFRKQGITAYTGAKVTKAHGERHDGVDDRCRAAGRQDATHSKPTTCSSRPAAARSRTASASRRSASSWIKGTSRWTSSTGQTWTASRRLATSSPSAKARAIHSSRTSVVGGRHSRRRADGRSGSPAAQLQPRARLHLLRSGNRQRRPDRAGGEGAGLRRAGRARSRSACSAGRGWPARPTVS